MHSLEYTGLPITACMVACGSPTTSQSRLDHVSPNALNYNEKEAEVCFERTTENRLSVVYRANYIQPALATRRKRRTRFHNDANNIISQVQGLTIDGA